MGSATHTLRSTGTIGPQLQVSVAFPTSGTVEAVNVVPGQHVSAGGVLARQVSTKQAAAVASANSALASAELTLYRDENGEGTGQTSSSAGHATASSTSTSASLSGSVSSSAGRSGGAKGSGSTGSSSAVSTATRQLLTTQHSIDTLLTSTRSDLALAVRLCTSATAAGPTPTTSATSPSPTASSGGLAATPTPTASSSPSGSGTPSGVHRPPAGTTPTPPTTCEGAQQQVLQEQAETLDKEQALSAQEVTLDRLLAQRAATTGSTSSGSSGSSASSSAGSSTSTTASAAQLAADQAEVDAAQAQVAIAVQTLAQTTIVSPITGTVVSVGFTVGQSAGSTSAVQLVGNSAHVATTQIPVSEIASVRAGQAAEVTPDGSGTPLPGSVVQVGVSAVSGSSSAEYEVTIGLPGSNTALHDGAGATVSIVTGRSSNAVVVPTSAVHTVGTSAFVTKLNDDGTTSTVRVTVAVVGPMSTSVTSVSQGALPLGSQVVLADLSAPLPTSETTLRPGGGAGFGGGFGGSGRIRTGGGGAGAG
jgi:HlyD family secretion protein